MFMRNVNLENKTVLITGAAGFIGSNLVLELLRTQSPVNIIGIDNLNDYYDVSIKDFRLSEIEKKAEKHPESIWTFIKGSIADKSVIDSIFKNYKPSVVELSSPSRCTLLHHQPRCVCGSKFNWFLQYS